MYIIIISTLLNCFSFSLSSQNLSFSQVFPTIDFWYVHLDSDLNRFSDLLCSLVCFIFLYMKFISPTWAACSYHYFFQFLIPCETKLAIHQFLDCMRNTCISYRIVCLSVCSFVAWNAYWPDISCRPARPPPRVPQMFPPPSKTLHPSREMYASGGGLLVAPMDAPHNADAGNSNKAMTTQRFCKRQCSILFTWGRSVFSVAAGQRQCGNSKRYI